MLQAAQQPCGLSIRSFDIDLVFAELLQAIPQSAEKHSHFMVGACVGGVPNQPMFGHKSSSSAASRAHAGHLKRLGLLHFGLPCFGARVGLTLQATYKPWLVRASAPDARNVEKLSDENISPLFLAIENGYVDGVKRLVCA